MTVSGRRCPNCKDVVWSRAGHDFRRCSCGDIFVDGGQRAIGGRIGYKSELPQAVTLEIYGADQRVVYDDWNWSDTKRGNKLGLVKGGTVDLRQRVVLVTDG